MELEGRVNGSLFNRIRSSLSGKIVSYGLAGILTLGIGYGCKDKGIKEVLKSRKETGKKQLTVFKNAEEYHINGDFEDARNWYVMVINDFSNTKEAAEASFRIFAIDCREVKYNLGMVIKEEKKAIEYMEEAKEYYSDFKDKIVEKANYHHRNSNKYKALIFEIIEKQLLDDFLNLKGYLKNDIDAWEVPDIDIISKNDGYNTCVGEMSTDGKVDDLKVRLMGGKFLHGYSEKTTEIGKKELKDIVKETENNPYNEIRYEAQMQLKDEPAWKSFKDNRGDLTLR